MKDLQAALDALQTQHLYRKPRIISGAQQPEVIVDGKPMLSFCSNDYLGLAADERVRSAFKKGIDLYGAGSGSAHLVTGHTAAHQALEEALADFTGRDRALLFSSGYMANLAVASVLVGRNDTILEDRLNHASLIDAGLLSAAKFHRYRHNDLSSAREKMQQAKGELLLMTDGVFSMDGDVAELSGLADLCHQQGAWMMVDDAHGIGVLGEQGQGSVNIFGLSQEQVPILMGTLGKAFGTAGAFIAGSEALIETLIQSARSYIYTTALPGAIAVATHASLKIVVEENWRRVRLQALIHKFQSATKELGLVIGSSSTPIQPIIVGDAKTALKWSQHLQQRGVLVAAIRPPTVPQGTARLRITLSAAHTDAQLDQLITALAEVQAIAS